MDLSIQWRTKTLRDISSIIDLLNRQAGRADASDAHRLLLQLAAREVTRLHQDPTPTIEQELDALCFAENACRNILMLYSHERLLWEAARDALLIIGKAIDTLHRMQK